jgi:hypothetical protein
MEATFHADPQLKRSLERANPRQLRSLLRRSTRKAARPVLEAAKQATPVKTGRLRASLGMVALQDSATGEIGVSIEPRASFSFRDTAGNRTVVTRRRRLSNSQIRSVSRGANVDRTSPWMYAYGIETGLKPKGKMARWAGGARMLGNALRSQSQSFFRTVGDDAFRFITTGN